MNGVQNDTMYNEKKCESSLLGDDAQVIIGEFFGRFEFDGCAAVDFACVRFLAEGDDRGTSIAFGASYRVGHVFDVFATTSATEEIFVRSDSLRPRAGQFIFIAANDLGLSL